MSKKTKKIAAKVHLWLGLPSGLVVFIVCITGCFYVFKQEITDASEPWRFIPAQDKAICLPSQVLAVANAQITDSIAPSAITYGEATDAVCVDYYDMQKGMTAVFVDQFEGAVIKTVRTNRHEFDFFKFVLQGHRHLWLPPEIGKPIVGYSVLLFAVTLITGLILWWPKKWNRKAIKRMLKFQKEHFNFSMHNTLGGYAAIVLLVLCFTGLVWSLDWFGRSFYYITSGGKELKPYVLPKSDTSRLVGTSNRLDELYLQLREQEPDAKTFYFALPQNEDDVIRVSIVHERGSFYKTDNLFFDRHSLQPLKGQGPYAGKYTEVSAADKLRRINLEVHDGRIFGLAGKVLVFLASLIGASLPVTGIMIWWRKRNKKHRKHKKHKKTQPLN